MIVNCIDFARIHQVCQECGNFRHHMSEPFHPKTHFQCRRRIRQPCCGFRMTKFEGCFGVAINRKTFMVQLITIVKMSNLVKFQRKSLLEQWICEGDLDRRSHYENPI